MPVSEREKLEGVIAGIQKRLPGAIEGEEDSYGDTVLIVGRKQCHDVLKHLNKEGFDLLLDIAGVDMLNLPHEERFQLVYFLYSIPKNLRLRVKVHVAGDDMNVPSATDLWEAANWAEREAYDMFGFVFEGHPNLARILCHREFEGHALRKDYPIMKGQWAATTSDLMPDLDKE